MLIKDSARTKNLIHEEDELGNALSSLSRLFQDLNETSIRYCHWKSNLRLPEALQGETDLDLLVDRKDSEEFRRVLYEHDIKPCMAPPEMRYPALEDYLGFDQTSGKLFHLHVHYQLVLGEQFVKNYRIPIEDQVLDSVHLISGVKVPAAEIELSILCIRALLKYRDRDFIKDYFSIRYPGIPDHIRNEIEYLSNKTSPQKIDQILSANFQLLPREIILDFLSKFYTNPRDGRGFFILRKNLRMALRDFQRYSRTKASWIYYKELWHRRSSPFPPQNRGKMNFINGGISLALIGIDGAGKSTLHQQLKDWLSWKMNISGFYMGSKQPSWTSEQLYMIFRMFRRGTTELTKLFGKGIFLVRWLNAIKQIVLSAHHLSIGSDRYKRYLSGSSLAKSGGIVLYDRFPLERVSSKPGYRLLDGPQITLSADQGIGFISNKLVSKELELYERMHLPDYLLILEVDPAVSLQRKPDHNQAVLADKYRAVQDLLAQEGDYRLICIDANLPYQEVLSELKSAVWKRL